MSDVQAASRPPTMDDAFAGNRLLSTFPADLRSLIDGKAKLVDLDLGATVLRRGVDVECAIFPFVQTMISLVVDMDDGRSVEVASFGRYVYVF